MREITGTAKKRGLTQEELAEQLYVSRTAISKWESGRGYPSSTTMLALCILPTAMMQLKTRIRGDAVRRAILGILAAFTFFMVVGRLISGVHWLTDIIGGVLLSVGLVMLYAFATKRQGKSRKNSLACV